MIRYASVCSGVEAASLAWEPLGWKPVWFSEIEPFPCAVLRERYPDVPNLGDMTKIKGEDYRGLVDLLVGGTPCQGFSTAGKQGGLDDERSVLCLSFLNLVRAMRPRWFVWENVPGVFSTNGGEDFKAFLRAIDEIGYSCAWRVLDAQYCRVDGYPRAVPQRRRRVFVVGHLGADWRYPAAVLFEPDRLQGDSPPRRVKGKGFTSGVERSVGEASRSLIFCVDQGAGKSSCSISKELAPTLATTHGGEPVIRVEGSGVAESRSEGANGSKRSVEAHADRHRRNTVFWNCNDYAEALTCTSDRQFMPDKARLQCVIEERNAVAIAENIIGRAARNGGNGIGVREEVAFAQNATGVMGVASPLTVRRLLPVECERLMGFPDNWTRIAWRGKPAEECPDSPRYKACGNSMCVNVMRWIGRRIDLVEGYKK